MAKIELLREQSLDYSYPAGQAQAGIQLAAVEIPWLLAEIERLSLRSPIQEVSEKVLTLVAEGL
jgi:hypothetical protein